MSYWGPASLPSYINDNMFVLDAVQLVVRSNTLYHRDMYTGGLQIQNVARFQQPSIFSGHSAGIIEPTTRRAGQPAGGGGNLAWQIIDKNDARLSSYSAFGGLGGSGGGPDVLLGTRDLGTQVYNCRDPYADETDPLTIFNVDWEVQVLLQQSQYASLYGAMPVLHRNEEVNGHLSVVGWHDKGGSEEQFFQIYDADFSGGSMFAGVSAGDSRSASTLLEGSPFKRIGIGSPMEIVVFGMQPYAINGHYQGVGTIDAYDFFDNSTPTGGVVMYAAESDDPEGAANNPYASVVFSKYNATTWGSPPTISCFTGGTKITMAGDTKKNIEDVNVGDKVVTLDTVDNSLIESTVTKKFEHPKTPGYKKINDVLNVTPNHEMYDGNLWKPISEYSEGECIYFIDGTYKKIEKIKTVNDEITTYNIEVDSEEHNYFAEGYCAHNKSIYWPPPPFPPKTGPTHPPWPPPILSCFLAGTKISMADGSNKNIEDVVVGDTVKAFNTDTGTVIDSFVTETFVHNNTNEYYIINGILKITGNHPVCINGEWKDVKDLRFGDKLQRLNGTYIKVKSINFFTNQNVTTYNIEVDNVHNYYANKILVHNKTIIGPPGGGGGGGGKPPTSCFLAGTHITLSDGTKKLIEYISVGDKVKSFNTKTGELFESTVSQTFIHHDTVGHFIINNDLHVTGDHPMWVNNKWVKVKDIKLNDELYKIDGSKLRITNITRYYDIITSYNFEVDSDEHNYFANDCLAHNKLPPWWPPPTCFTAGTKISMGDGTEKNIEDIKFGDIVKVCNTDTNENITSSVTKTFTHPDTEGYLIINDELNVTKNHPLYTGGRWISAGDFQIDDTIQYVDHTFKNILSIEYCSDKVTTYNIEVESEFHNYYANGYLAHNSKTIVYPPPTNPTKPKPPPPPTVTPTVSCANCSTGVTSKAFFKADADIQGQAYNLHICNHDNSRRTGIHTAAIECIAFLPDRNEKFWGGDPEFYKKLGHSNSAAAQAAHNAIGGPSTVAYDLSGQKVWWYFNRKVFFYVGLDKDGNIATISEPRYSITSSGQRNNIVRLNGPVDYTINNFTGCHPSNGESGRWHENKFHTFDLIPTSLILPDADKSIVKLRGGESSIMNQLTPNQIHKGNNRTWEQRGNLLGHIFYNPSSMQFGPVVMQIGRLGDHTDNENFRTGVGKTTTEATIFNGMSRTLTAADVSTGRSVFYVPTNGYHTLEPLKIDNVSVCAVSGLSGNNDLTFHWKNRGSYRPEHGSQIHMCMNSVQASGAATSIPSIQAGGFYTGTPHGRGFTATTFLSCVSSHTPLSTDICYEVESRGVPLQAETKINTRKWTIPFGLGATQPHYVASLSRSKFLTGAWDKNPVYLSVARQQLIRPRKRLPIAGNTTGLDHHDHQERRFVIYNRKLVDDRYREFGIVIDPGSKYYSLSGKMFSFTFGQYFNSASPTVTAARVRNEHNGSYDWDIADFTWFTGMSAHEFADLLITYGFDSQQASLSSADTYLQLLGHCTYNGSLTSDSIGYYCAALARTRVPEQVSPIFAEIGGGCSDCSGADGSRWKNYVVCLTGTELVLPYLTYTTIGSAWGSTSVQY